MGMIYRFGQLFNVVDGDRGKNYPKDCDFSDKGYCLFLNAGNVTKNGWSFENNSFITEEKDQLLHNGRLTRENTVFTTRGTVGNAAYYGKNIPFEHIRINSGMVILSSKDTSLIQNKFIYYLVTSPYAKKTIEMFCSGSAQPQLPIKDFVKIKFNLPSIEHQQKIALILSAYDNLIENNNKRIKILEQMAENLYKEWFVRFRFPNYQNTEIENGIPKGWKVVKIKKCVKRLAFNRLYKGNELEKEGNVIVIDQSANEYLGFHNNEPSHYANYENPIILFGDHTCKCKLMCKDFSLGENVVPFRSCDTNFTDTYFLYYAVHKIITTEEYKRHWGRFVILKILVPPIELQRKYSKLVVWFEEEKEVLFKHNLNLIKQRDMLLPRLMSGKLEVK